jgi:hypothetical protein
MTVEATVDYAEPNPQRPEQGVRAQATAAVMRLLGLRPDVASEVRETWRTRVHLLEMTKRSDAADLVAAEAAQYEANLDIRFDPGGQRSLGFGLGVAVVAALVILDAFPLNWAAQAFGLDPDGTWLVTFILVIASVGAMLGFELTRGRASRRRVLTVVFVAGYLALLALRTEFLATVSTGSLLVAFLQSALLTSISAGLVWCGSAVLARTRSRLQSRARAAARRAARAAEEARAARLHADTALERNIAVLQGRLLHWDTELTAPQGIDHAQWTDALNGAVHELFQAP